MIFSVSLKKGCRISDLVWLILKVTINKKNKQIIKTAFHLKQTSKTPH